jgi:hypothetical protein
MLVLLLAAFLGAVVGALASRLRVLGRGRTLASAFVGSLGSLFGYLVTVFSGVESAIGWVVLPALGIIVFLTLYWLFLRFRSPSPSRRPQPTEARSQRSSTSDASGIFLSYASSDREVARKLAATLEQQGWSVWWDRTILPGKSFDEVIEAALNGTRCVIVLWSATSVSSDWVKNEAREGLRRRILIPALLDGTTIPFEFRHIQAADLTGWPSSNHVGFQTLVASLSAMLGVPKSATGASAQ